MAFTSFNFLVFLALVITVYYLVPRKYQWCVLLAASYGFYLSSGITHVLYIIGTTLFTYGAGRWMQKIRDNFQAELKTLGDTVTKDQKKEMKKAVGVKIRRVQVLTVLVNLASAGTFFPMWQFTDDRDRCQVLNISATTNSHIHLTAQPNATCRYY